MRASELLGRVVVGPSGEPCGRVLDVRLVQDGPLLGAFAALRIQGFVVGTRRAGARLGYDRYGQHGPWLVRRAVRWWLKENWYLRWEDAQLENGQITCSAGERPPVPEI